jgi:hypothetical protein
MTVDKADWQLSVAAYAVLFRQFGKRFDSHNVIASTEA